MPAGIFVTHTGGHALALAVTIPHHCSARLQESRMLPRSCTPDSCASGASCVTRVDSCSWQHFEEIFLGGGAGGGGCWIQGRLPACAMLTLVLVCGASSNVSQFV